MSCQTCGRTEEGGGGHYLGCSEVFRTYAHNLAEPDFSGALCDYPDCHNPKYSASPRAKYCEDHKDPKNRKE